MRAGQTEPPFVLHPAESTRHSLNRKPKVVCDIAARHRQVDMSSPLTLLLYLDEEFFHLSIADLRPSSSRWPSARRRLRAVRHHSSRATSMERDAAAMMWARRKDETSAVTTASDLRRFEGRRIFEDFRRLKTLCSLVNGVRHDRTQTPHRES